MRSKTDLHSELVSVRDRRFWSQFYVWASKFDFFLSLLSCVIGWPMDTKLKSSQLEVLAITSGQITHL